MLGIHVKVLFVCMGNICRSPMVEVVFRECVSVKRRTSFTEVVLLKFSDN